MRTACILAEYDPFHAGHAAMAARLHAQGFEAVVALMGGYCLQRGTPAALPPEVRCAAALAGGVDLVLALPCRAGVAAAPRFAAAGAAMAAAAGAAVMAFGAETPDLAALTQLAGVLRAPAAHAPLAAALDAGLPFYAARAQAAAALLPGAQALLAQPNTNLALEYLMALQDLAPLVGSAAPARVVLPRVGARHDGAPAGGIASAGWLRAQPVQAWGPYVPAAALPLYQQAFAQGNVPDAARWECALLALLRRADPAGFALVPDMTEGLHARLARAVARAGSLPELYALIKSKRYTHARIRRLVLAAALGWQKEPPAPPPRTLEDACRAAGVPYLLALGATPAGEAALADIARHSPIPVGHSLARLAKTGPAAARAAADEAALCDLYALCLVRPQPCGGAYRRAFLHAPA